MSCPIGVVRCIDNDPEKIDARVRPGLAGGKALKSVGLVNHGIEDEAEKGRS
jgi:hypothetical protein